jgi:phosphoadenylyl-sulfate reductase (thioredoxin)
LIPAEQVVLWAIETYGPRLALSTSFQKEGMVILDMAARIDPGIRVFTLDTGRLPPETYQMMDTVADRYGIEIERVPPDSAEVARMVSEHGPDLYYNDVPSRMLCCQIRKVRPLERQLSGFDACLVGLRRSQSESRANVEQIDRTSTPVKISPLADWTPEQVEIYTRENDVPMHPLYAHGFQSIGCAPCTRAVAPGESERAGRWWWEEDVSKECGIHFTPDGRARRKVDILLEQILAVPHA